MQLRGGRNYDCFQCRNLEHFLKSGHNSYSVGSEVLIGPDQILVGRRASTNEFGTRDHAKNIKCVLLAHATDSDYTDVDFLTFRVLDDPVI